MPLVSIYGIYPHEVWHGQVLREHVSIVLAEVGRVTLQTDHKISEYEQLFI